MEKLILTTEDHINLVAHLFKPERDNGKLLLINSATGVKQQVYFSFASYFCEQGFTVITYDYRGIGLSKPKNMRGFQGSMRLWGSKDYKTITQYIKSAFKEYKKYCLGHSVGALILGMNEDSNIFEEFVFVGTQNAFVGNLKGRTKVEAYLGFGIAQPLTTSLLGYFPAHWFGLGESLPKNCAYDWRTLILNKKSTNKLLEKIDDFSKNLTQKVFVIRAEDDIWLTEKGVLSLLNNTYSNLKPTYRLIAASESDKNEIGHINFFRSYNSKLWDIILNELIDK
ncbi:MULTISPECIES: alpha/beta hydrolase [Chryseobacterium]|uniref:Alpha/beta hydrolase n=1 Tax=Chryseobacterium cucumeris TaxID=1813611 RepID=A0ABX9X5Q8_9FLAO|nr:MULTISPECIES: alpha/beta hydrolase [Chryseobacterium]KYH05462.1 alpha/beta hydrolase [Chryseobacterium cucumeris]QWT85677.1 alpha/beta hydrolase [Chryseobacterium sp. PCH239]ROH90283.1 alpha/beta hydrolase [Chryseobacterium cucumeris]WFB69754.1 alpha/beta hydrolase [Chryseobacterium sp. WX]